MYFQWTDLVDSMEKVIQAMLKLWSYGCVVGFVMQADFATRHDDYLTNEILNIAKIV